MRRQHQHLHEQRWPTLREREETLGWFGCSRIDIGLHVLSGTAHVTVLEHPPTLHGAARDARDRREQLDAAYRACEGVQ